MPEPLRVIIMSFSPGRRLEPVANCLYALFFARLLLSVLALLLCVGQPAGRARAGEKFDFSQMNEAQERLLLYPSLVSADDYRKGAIAQRKINVSALFRGESGAEAAKKSAAYHQRLQRAAAPVTSWRPKAGILFAAGFAPQRAARALLQAAPAIMAGFNFVYLDPTQLQAVLKGFRYRQALNNPVAVASFLAEYPGSRYLFFLDRVHLPAGYPGFVELDFFVVDGYDGNRFPGRRAREAVTAPWQIDQALGRCLYQAVSLLQPVVRAARPQGRVFLVQGNIAYLNVGFLSGLRPGQELEVLAPAREIRDPRTGLPVGRVAGPAHGRIKIIRGFGFDLAEARLLAGGVRMGDIVEW